MFIRKSQVPPELLNDPRVAGCELAIGEVWANPECRWATCIHEASHGFYYQQGGVQSNLCAPAIIFRDGHFYPGFLAVNGDESQMSLKQFARLLVAGNIAGSLLPAHQCKHCRPPLDLSQSTDYEDFMSSGRAPISDLKTEWSAAEQEVEKELRYTSGAWNEVVRIAREIESFVLNMEENAKEDPI